MTESIIFRSHLEVTAIIHNPQDAKYSFMVEKFEINLLDSNTTKMGCTRHSRLCTLSMVSYMRLSVGRNVAPGT